MRIEEYMESLPDVYDKGEDSNNYKLLQMERKLISDLEKDIEDVENTLDIRKAFGKTLDRYGEIYGQDRGELTDAQYRIVILQKAIRNSVGGDANSIILALASAFGVDASSFGLAETENVCEIRVTGLPYSILQNVGMTQDQVKKMIDDLTPIGVKSAPLELDGTFEFASSYGEYDEDAGFGNIDQTIGGYLGYLEGSGAIIP